MWETHRITDWICSKTQTLMATFRTRNQLQEVSFVFFGCRTFVPVRWMCKKQTVVSHSSPESEIVSLDAGLRMDGLLALDLWDILHSTNNTVQPKHNSIQPFQNQDLKMSKEGKRLINCLMWIMSPLAHTFVKVSLSCTFLKTTKVSSK